MNPHKFESARSVCASEITSTIRERRLIICSDKWKSEQRVCVCPGPRRYFLFIRRIVQRSPGHTCTQTSDSSGEKDEKMSGDRRRGAAAAAAAGGDQPLHTPAEMLTSVQSCWLDPDLWPLLVFFFLKALSFFFVLVLLKVILPDLIILQEWCYKSDLLLLSSLSLLWKRIDKCCYLSIARNAQTSERLVYTGKEYIL